MIRKSFWAILILIFWVAGGAAFFHTDGTRIVDSQGNPVQLRGMGLGGWIFPEGYMLHIPGFGSPTSIRNQILELIGPEDTEEFFRRYRANYVDEQDIRQLAEWGFNHIRLPFSYRLFYDEQSQVFDEAGFQFFETFLGWCKKYGIYVILDMHGAPGGQNKDNISDSDGIEARLWTDTTNQTLTVKIWKEIARRYADEGQIIGYDLLNEPVLPSGYSNTVLRDFYIRLTNAIREVDTNHILFMEGNWYATDFSLLTPPWDNNMVYSFHKYWSETDVSTIQYLLNIRSQYNVPLWMGESGENSNPWFYETVRMLESHNVGWCWWTHKKIETITSPYSANMTPEYQQLLDYWAGNGPRPTAEFARKALFEMAENLKSSRCRYNPGVIPALFDPEFGTIAKPMKEHLIPGTIQAVDFDLGTNQIAYSDRDYKRVRWDVFQPWNLGYQYRNDGVDIEKSQDVNGPAYSIGWIEDGEWVRYTVQVMRKIEIKVKVRVASETGQGRLRLLFNGEQIVPDFNIPVTGGWHEWKTYDLGMATLEGGTGTLEWRALQGGFNLSQLLFLPVEESGFKPLNGTGYVGLNYPNPFNESTTIPVILLRRARVRLDIYDPTGQLVQNVFADSLPEGTHLLKWDGRGRNGVPLAGGIYFYQVSINDAHYRGRMILIK